MLALTLFTGAGFGVTFLAATVKAHDTKDETEIIPAAVIMDFVNVHAILKQGNDKCEQGNKSMPQSFPEAGHCVGSGSIY